MVALDTIDSKRRVRVKVIDEDRWVKAHLATLGIHPGDRLTVVGRSPFRGPVVVEINGTRHALSRGVAARIHVETDGVTSLLVERPPEDLAAAG